MAYAPAATAGTSEFSILLWAPVLLITFGCVAWLLWLIVADARKYRASRRAPAATTDATAVASDELEELVATRMELQKVRERLLCDFGGAPVSGG